MYTAEKVACSGLQLTHFKKSQYIYFPKFWGTIQSYKCEKNSRKYHSKTSRFFFTFGIISYESINHFLFLWLIDNMSLFIYFPACFSLYNALFVIIFYCIILNVTFSYCYAWMIPFFSLYIYMYYEVMVSSTFQENRKYVWNTCRMNQCKLSIIIFKFQIQTY